MWKTIELLIIYVMTKKVLGVVFEKSMDFFPFKRIDNMSCPIED